jgi:glyoxylase-like metal-dependent hydrolase (beta-lactamase superfamily II)
MADTPTYEIHAIRYARHDRRASENFLGGDPHDAPMPIDYFVWTVTGGGRTFVVDTGFGAEQARLRGRELLRSPVEGLKGLGIDPAKVDDVIITHMHYDHAGNLDLFPNATFHIQDREMQFCTGRCMTHGELRHGLAEDDVVGMVRRLFDGRVQFHDGAEEIAPGLWLHFIGGHTMGLQSLRVMTRRGWVVLASDAAHLYAHLEQDRCFPIVYDVADMLEGHRTLQRLASTPRHIIPGHDPLVMKRYPASGHNLEGIAVRVDADPIA